MPSRSPAVPASSPSGGSELPLPNEEEVLDAIRQIARDDLQFHGELRPDAHLLRDLGLDSMGMIILAVALENRYRLRLNEADAQGLETVGHLSALVVRRAREQREQA